MGGHIDRDELPEEAALREIKEESGLEVTLHNSDSGLNLSETKELHRPVHLLLENINPFHQHIDFIYYAKTESFDLHPEDGETDNLKWLSREELEKIDMPDNVRACALEALQIFTS